MIKKMLAGMAMALLSFSAQALELDDLHMPLTRTEADESLTKDYTFCVLNDGSIRRTWTLPKRTVQVDFDSADDSAISIIVLYNSPVGRKTADADADKLTGEGAPKWKKTKPEAVEKVGIAPGAMIKEIEGSGMLFMELNSSNKVTRLSFFAKAPKSSRWDLSAVTGDARTAMGSSSTHGNIKGLIQDETVRQQTPNNAGTKSTATTSSSSDILDVETTVSLDTGSGSSSASPATATAATASTTPKTTTSKPKPTASTTTTQTKAVHTAMGTTYTTESIETTVEEVEDTDAPQKNYNNLADVLKGELTPVHYCIGGAVVLLLLFIFGGSISRARAKARQRAQFANVLLSTPATKPAAPRAKSPAAPTLRRK